MKSPEERKRIRKYLRGIINSVKDTPCADCGAEFEDKNKLTFDHLPQFKKYGDMSDFIRKRSRRQLLVEMSKCDIVCRSCHDMREMLRSMVKESKKCFLGCTYKSQQRYLCFIDGCAEQVVCESCAKSIQRKQVGMTYFIKKLNVKFLLGE